MKIDSRARASEKATGRRSKEVEGGRGVEANLDARNNRIAGRSATGGTEVSEKALVPESNGITGRTQVSEKGPGAGKQQRHR